MNIDGYYYLHTNGDLIYKRDLDGGTAADLRESDFVRTFWHCDISNRAHAWRIIVESRALGANDDRVQELEKRWGCNDADAAIYAERIGIRLFMDGNMWCATRKDFVNLQESPAGFGETCAKAMSALVKELGYTGGKTWGEHTETLVAVQGKA